MIAAFAAVALIAACDQSPVTWQDPTAVANVSGRTRLVIDSAGAVRFVPDSISVPAPIVFNQSICQSSVGMVRGTGHLHAVWWAVRPDSSAGLYTARSSDSGRTWEMPQVVDTSDRSSRGCSRPPPSVTIVGDDVHVAYSMVAPEGTGVFFAHFMGSMLHSPVPIIYGDHLVPTAIAALGDTVAVAYEDPNGPRRRVDLALSWTQGHIFEYHTTASPDVDVATAPAVALTGRAIAVVWTAVDAADSARARVARIGRIVHPVIGQFQ